MKTLIVHRQSQEEYIMGTQHNNREERLALTLRVVHIPYNLLSSSSEQFKTSQKAAAFW
jgi:hypothetical protein